MWTELDVRVKMCSPQQISRHCIPLNRPIIDNLLRQIGFLFSSGILQICRAFLSWKLWVIIWYFIISYLLSHQLRTSGLKFYIRSSIFTILRGTLGFGFLFSDGCCKSMKADNIVNNLIRYFDSVQINFTIKEIHSTAASSQST